MHPDLLPIIMLLKICYSNILHRHLLWVFRARLVVRDLIEEKCLKFCRLFYLHNDYFDEYRYLRLMQFLIKKNRLN